MYSKLKEMLGLSHDTSDENLKRVCNEYYYLYRVVSDNTTDFQVKKLAEQKRDALVKAMEAEGLDVKSALAFSVDDYLGVSEGGVEKILTKGVDEAITPQERATVNALINRPSGNEKGGYYQACLHKAEAPFIIENAETVVGYIAQSRSADPENPVYQMMLEDIQANKDKTEAKYKAFKIQRNEEIARDGRRAKIKKILGGIGSGLLGILTVVGGILLGALECFCECCDGC